MAEMMPINPTTLISSTSVNPRAVEAVVRTWGIAPRRGGQAHFNPITIKNHPIRMPDT